MVGKAVETTREGSRGYQREKTKWQKDEKDERHRD